MSRGRRLAVGALVVLAAVAMVLALLVGYVRRAAVDSDQFANRANVAVNFYRRGDLLRAVDTLNGVRQSPR